MARKRYKPEEIVAKLRQVDVLVSQGQSVVDAVRSIGVTDVTYYRWRSEFGGLKTDKVRGGLVSLNRFRGWDKWISASVMLRPGLAAAG